MRWTTATPSACCGWPGWSSCSAGWRCSSDTPHSRWRMRRKSRKTSMPRRCSSADSLVDLPRQVELSQCARSQFAQSGLRVLRARLVGEEVDKNIAAYRQAERKQLHLPAYSLKPLPRYALPGPSGEGVLTMSSIDQTDYRTNV